jgi:glycosyltransferase involved in cell wall biosynthesis
VEKPEDTIAKASELFKEDIIAELGSRSRQFVQKYDWEMLTDSFIKVLEEEIGKKKNGQPSQGI